MILVGRFDVHTWINQPFVWVGSLRSTALDLELEAVVQNFCCWNSVVMRPGAKSLWTTEDVALCACSVPLARWLGEFRNLSPQPMSSLLAAYEFKFWVHPKLKCGWSPEVLAVGVHDVNLESLRLAINRNFGDGPAGYTRQRTVCAWTCQVRNLTTQNSFVTWLFWHPSR